MLYNVLKAMVARGQTDGLAEKLDIFFAVGHITAEQYEELTAAVGGGTNDR